MLDDFNAISVMSSMNVGTVSNEICNNHEIIVVRHVPMKPRNLVGYRIRLFEQRTLHDMV